MPQLSKILMLCAIALQSNAMDQRLITAKDIVANQGSFYLFVENEVGPQVKRLAPPATAGVFARGWGSLISKVAEVAGPAFTNYSAKEIKGAKNLSYYFADANRDGRKRALEALPNSANDIEFINNLLAEVKDERDGDTRAETKHKFALAYLKEHAIITVDLHPAIEEMGPIYHKINDSINQLLTNHLFVQFACEKDLVYVVE